MATKNILNSSQRLSFAPQTLYPFEFFQLLGLDTYNPDEVADPRRCVYGRNFRLYNPEDQTSRVALSKRQGHIFYSVPVGETVDQQITSTTGAADKIINLVTRQAQKITAGATGVLSRVDIRLDNTASGNGPAIVAFYSDNSGKPGTLLGTSSITSSSITGSYQYLSARYIEAPTVTSGTVYWVVSYVQSDGGNSYNWSSTTSATTAMVSTDAGNTWSSTSYALNVKTYVSTSGGVKGHTRFYRSTASPVTLMAHNTNVYTVNDVSGAITSIKSGLSASATDYDWANVNDVIYYANGFDSLQKYNGTTNSTVSTAPITPVKVEVHANCLFVLQPSTNYVAFSDPGSYESFGSTSFLYVPSPKTADPVIEMLSVQGVMYFFTRNTKYLLYGTDLLSFVLKESPATKGAVADNAICVSEDSVYFMSDDFHIYAFDGGRDTRLSSERVAAILRNLANTSSVTLYVDDKKLYVSYTPTGQTVNQHRLVYDLTFNEWLNDEEVYTNSGVSWNSQSDTNQIVLSSSRLGALYYGDSGYNDLGKPIDFDWWSKYMSFGTPAAKKRVKRYYTFLQTQNSNQEVDCQIDVDEQNSPTSNMVPVEGSGSLWGSAVWGSFTWGQLPFVRTRITVPGQNYKYQFRFVQSGVDNKVGILGFTIYLLPKRPV